MMLPRTLIIFAVLIVASCAAYDGRGLTPGEAGLEDVVAAMGEPAMHWRDADGSRQLAYPRGPAGFHTFMVRLGPNGKLQSIENVLDDRHLATIRAGMSKEDVLRLLGPSDAVKAVHFAARNELVWDWRYRQGFGDPMRMMVLFDAASGKVRSTMVQPEQSVSVETGAR